MISLNLSQTLAFNIGIEIFSIIITLIIWKTYRREFADTYDNRLLCHTEEAVFTVLVSDIFTWILDGRSGTLIRNLYTFDIMLYFFMQIIVALLWLYYAYYRIYGQHLSWRKGILAYIIFCILGGIIISSPFTGLCFYLDSQNIYHRGNLSALMALVLLVFLLVLSLLARWRIRYEKLLDRKRELKTISMFAVPPLLAGTFQTLHYGLSLLWPGVVISCLLILLNRESQAVSLDHLTGLNNRRNMEKYLRMPEEEQNYPLSIILLDLNDFKEINDVQGHDTGDVALTRAADLLRSTFGGTSAFLARYGGDEFVVILPGSDEAAARYRIQEIKASFSAFSQTKQVPFRLSVSAGYAVSRGNAADCLNQLLKEADERMYEDKLAYHRQTGSQRYR